MDKPPFTFHITTPGDICSILPQEGVQEDGLVIVDWPIDHPDYPKRIRVTMREIIEKGTDNTVLGTLPESLKMQLGKSLCDLYRILQAPDKEKESVAADLGYRKDSHAVH